MKKAVVFDLNGVLIIGPLLSERIKEEKGVLPEDFMPALNEIMAKVRMPGANNLYSYWESYLKKWHVQMSEREFMDFWFQPEKESMEMVALVRDLKASGYKLFVLSNNLRERSAYYDEHFPFLKELFDKQYYSWKTGFIKPDKRAYNLILEENNLKPEEVIYFDDSKSNIAAAQALGIESYLFKGADDVKERVQ